MEFLRTLMQAFGRPTAVSRASSEQTSEASEEGEQNLRTQIEVCPRCGNAIEKDDWRCSDCYCEFGNFNFDTGKLEGEPIAAKQEWPKDPDHPHIEARPGTEAQKVYIEVAKRKGQARSLGLDELMVELFFSEIRHYPSRLKHDRNTVPEDVTEARNLNSKNSEIQELIEITIYGNNYSFEFTEHSFSLPDGDYATHGTVTLFSQKRKVFSVVCSLDSDQYGSKWRSFSIEAFVEGDWISDFEKLRQEVRRAQRRREIERAEDPEHIAELKRNFGID